MSLHAVNKPAVAVAANVTRVLHVRAVGEDSTLLVPLDMAHPAAVALPPSAEPPLSPSIGPAHRGHDTRDSPSRNRKGGHQGRR